MYILCNYFVCMVHRCTDFSSSTMLSAHHFTAYVVCRILFIFVYLNRMGPGMCRSGIE